jgi:hypothetical protein
MAGRLNLRRTDNWSPIASHLPTVRAGQSALAGPCCGGRGADDHDALEFSDGRTVLLTLLCEGQAATVLQLPARPMTAAEADAQKRVTYLG